ncbi:hypothetical protein B0H11DRAFT_1740349 [Mycena galericulata]|nr:hypothetical protein B0H11DRAFT_1740349 [Mycena galericulata]
MSSIHLKRAKAWQTTEFNAEWLQNAVKYCRNDPDGKRGFESSLVKDFGEEEARNCLFHCTLPGPRRISGSPPADGSIWLAQAAVSMSEGALGQYAQYVQLNDLAAPPRLKPAIKRRRGEGSIAWLSRRHDAHMDGHKVPEMDWVTARAIAISEFDRVRDTWEGWHTSPEGFFDEIHDRGKTTILSPQILANPDKDWVRWHKFDDAFRGRVYSLTLAHMVWLHASELFEELFDMGLTTSSQIERQYKKDRRLMMRLIACYVKMEGLALHLWSNMGQVLSASENIAPCLIRRRTESGMPDIRLDKSPAGKAAHETLNELEKHIVWVCWLPASCDESNENPGHHPHAADRFDAGTFEILGELLTVHEFLKQMELSTFGKNLMSCSRSLQGTELDLWEVMCPMERPAVWPNTGYSSPWGDPYSTMVAVRNAWRDIAWHLNMQGLQGPAGLPARVERREYLPPAIFDDMWHTFDLVLWVRSTPHAQPGRHRALARHFGLYDVEDPLVPTCTGVLLREMANRALDLQAQAETRHASEARARALNEVVITASQNAAQSGHAYLVERGINSDRKPKTRNSTSVAPIAAPTEASEEDEDEDELVPEFLPSGYKIGKKVLKVFHRILEDDKSVEYNPELKKGQIRWDVFEKAMKRVGFAVCQTAGSTVRFDPPAKNARPITFHRPHPDSLLSPHSIKW